MASTANALSVSQEIFNLIRGQENNFPFPVKKATVTVGTFDAATGKFSYSVPTYTEEIIVPGGKPPKVILKGGKVTAINAIEVILRFTLKNRTGEVKLAIPGLPVIRTSTASSITVSVGAAASLLFTLSSGSKKFVSELPLEISTFTAGAGVFEVPAFPIAIIYAPVPDAGLRNASKWTVTQSTGNTTSFSVGKSTSTTQPVAPEFDNVNFLTDKIRLVSKALDELNGKKGFNGDFKVEVISRALKAVADALGSSSASATAGISTVSEHSVKLSIAKEQTITTNAASGGPGSGDLIFYLKNVKLAWFTTSVGRVRVTVFGHDGIGVTSVGFLKNGGQTDLDAETAAEFLKLDPFVAGGPSATLPADRFVYLDTIDLNGGEISQTETHTITTEDSRKIIVTKSHVQKNTKGLLSFLGLGVTDDLTAETVVTHSSAVQKEDSRAISNSISLFAGPAERYSMEVFCDVIFGTFAYREAGSAADPVLDGTIRGGDGRAAAGELVTLINNGRRFTTRADAGGRYAFHAKTIRPGRAELAVRGITRQSLTLGAGPAKRDIVL